MSIREDVELYTKLSGEDGSQETIATIGAYLRGYRQGKEDAEPHWIPVTEPPKGDFMLYYATCRSKVDDRENWVIEGMYTKYSGWEYPPMVRADKAEIIAWMPKELPEPFKGVTE